jgi:hypothetical protein
MPTASDGASFSNISATTAAFKLGGGRYNVMAVATGFGTVVQLQVLGPDGATWLLVGTNFAANGFQTVDVGPGQYRFGITGATGVYASVWRVPS